MTIRKKIIFILKQLEKEFPGYTPKPSKANPLNVLIATMLSQNTTDKTSYIAYKNLTTVFKSWEEIMKSPVKKIYKAIKICGLANQKAKNIKSLLKSLKKTKGELNLDFIKSMRDEDIYSYLEEFNGVGVKTISCVLAFGLGRDVFPVDTHIHRLSNRLGLVQTKSAEETFEEIKNILPEGKKFFLHTLLIRYGRKTCRARNPICSECILYDVCTYDEKEYYADSQSSTLPKENNFIILEEI